jgi:thymidylate synthase
MHGEDEYLQLIRRILREGEPRVDRTGVGTLSVFHHAMRFDLADGFPLLTTKRTNFTAIKEELLWFLRGDTDSTRLAERGVRIWDANGSRAALDALGFTDRRVGDLGPVYGFQWRHFGASYVDADASYDGQGVDQIQGLVDSITTHPTSRRHILCAWNPRDMSQMALPPCHVLAQFYVSNDQRLHCHLYQRSGDVGLGVPFNIASYALLTHMIAHCCGLAPGVLHHTLGDAHVYANHVEALKTQLARDPRPWPTLHLAPHVSNIFEFDSDDISLQNYDPHPFIIMPMAV